MTQYEIWWANFPAPAGRRPVLLLSRPEAFLYLNKFVAAEITTTVRNIAQEVMLGSREGLTKPCAANFDNLRTVARSALVSRIGRLETRRRPEVIRAVAHTFGWPDLLDALDSPGSVA